MELGMKLGKTLGEIKAIPLAEFYQWHAFCSLKPQDFMSVEDQLRAVFGKPKNV